MTLPEVLLWNRIKQDQLGFQFRRQCRFDKYVLDFYCPELRVAIEIDGKVHSFRKASDPVRDEFLKSQRLTILRFSAKAVLSNSNFVASQIKEFLEKLKADGDQNTDLL